MKISINYFGTGKIWSTPLGAFNPIVLDDFEVNYLKHFSSEPCGLTVDDLPAFLNNLRGDYSLQVLSGGISVKSFLMFSKRISVS